MDRTPHKIGQRLLQLPLEATEHGANPLDLFFGVRDVSLDVTVFPLCAVQRLFQSLSLLQRNG